MRSTDEAWAAPSALVGLLAMALLASRMLSPPGGRGAARLEVLVPCRDPERRELARRMVAWLLGRGKMSAGVTVRSLPWQWPSGL